MVGKMENMGEYGDGVSWFRGSMIGKGGFGCVYLATLKNPKSKYSYFPSLMAVKSAEVSASGSIQKEREVLCNVQGCPDIIKCFGDETTMGKNGSMVYNLLLEYGSGGTLADRIKESGSQGLPEVEAKMFAKSILRGLCHVHGLGYVHCDLKPENILLMSKSKIKGGEFRAKIGDFGLTKRAKLKSKKRKLFEEEAYWRGTPMYLSPEAVIDNVQDAPCDIWAFGCIVLETLTGKPPWDEKTSKELLGKIREVRALPNIPNGISKEAKDFLKGCFVRKSTNRLTAEMLLHHPFVEGLVDCDDEEADEVDEEVEDLSEVELVCNSDGELSGNSCSYWTDEDGEDVDDEIVSGIEMGRNVDGVVGSSTEVGFDRSNDGSRRVKPRVMLESRQHCPVSAGISAAIC